MKGGSIKVVGIESKSFELRVVGTYEDILKISEPVSYTHLTLPTNREV